ncbi:type 1 glutamine amidotransferase family protein [Tenacibaculum maritimum]|uniref:type 1 glutamine amidotransferase family protein n=1 Tax=Tenacibaculum maritimum TaxID=107401 RepID=UPI0010A3BD1E|nr:type 1 glutamine amidotransferase family protein [Tenacibaculum maritimum]QCD63709.1 glutamine amidotransferase [Tenacibaculum maritimum]CAA0143575.1 putative factor of the oxidative stress response YoaZ [Tenacibaculum maritimum]CAA0144246.1 putative factor of the oxidative stress response YoaZ [Tenacibaculum maritimum]CAA0204874.1 putative factor of the oxidative stress response YoaZ [Tenacibaculum maritimum]CAA0208096.1 putative factor of the oxidative stress response YoaZ [Tenacibaculum 
MVKKKVYVLLFEGFSDWEISYLAPGLQKNEGISLSYFTVDGAPIRSVGGLHIQPDFSISEIDTSEVSALILPGGTFWEKETVKEIDVLVDELHAEDKIVGAICGATTYLAKRGYLDDVKHTSNSLDYLKMFAKSYKGSRYYQDELAVTDGNLITANGVAPIEFAREVFKAVELYSDANIEKWFHLFKEGVWAG